MLVLDFIAHVSPFLLSVCSSFFRFPLYQRGERFHFEYGVYLLNKNIAQVNEHTTTRTLICMEEPSFRYEHLGSTMDICCWPQESVRMNKTGVHTQVSCTFRARKHLPHRTTGQWVEEEDKDTSKKDTSGLLKTANVLTRVTPSGPPSDISHWLLSICIPFFLPLHPGMKGLFTE